MILACMILASKKIGVEPGSVFFFFFLLVFIVGLLLLLMFHFDVCFSLYSWLVIAQCLSSHKAFVQTHSTSIEVNECGIM